MDAMRREFNKSKDFQNPDIEPPVEFSMDDYYKAVQEPEEEGPITELPENETAQNLLQENQEKPKTWNAL